MKETKQKLIYTAHIKLKGEPITPEQSKELEARIKSETAGTRGITRYYGKPVEYYRGIGYRKR